MRVEEFVRVVETWQTQKREVFKRQTYSDGANPASLREFVEIQNRLSKRLVSGLEKQDPDFWQSLVELAMNCARMVEPDSPRVYVDGTDRSQEGM